MISHSWPHAWQGFPGCVPPVFVFTDATPDGNDRWAPSYPGAPPMIPHSLDGSAAITLSDNTCLLCHQTGSTDPADPPQIPRSHLIDFRRAPDVVRETVAGARWSCTACDLIQSNAPVLVENRFTPAGRQGSGRGLRVCAACRYRPVPSRCASTSGRPACITFAWVRSIGYSSRINSTDRRSVSTMA